MRSRGCGPERGLRASGRPEPPRRDDRRRGEPAFPSAFPFAYTGPGGRLRLRRRFELIVPAQAVRRHGLVDGDLVGVILGPDGCVHLSVVRRVPRTKRFGRVRPVRGDREASGGRIIAWEVLEEGAPVGWVSDEEARHRCLEEGDPISVIGPSLEAKERVSLWVPAPGLSPLPRVRVLGRYEAAGSDDHP